MATVTGLTIADFERLPDAIARNHEVVDGELVDVSGNNGEHIGLRDALVELLRPYVRLRKLGRLCAEQEFQFGENSHGPDVSFFGPEKLPLYDKRLRVQRFVPDLAIEIVSPSDEFEDLRKKLERYRRCGVKEAFMFGLYPPEIYVFSDRPTIVLTEAE